MSNLVVIQATDDKVTYKFNVGNLSGNTIVSTTLSSTDLTLTNISNDTSNISVTVDSTGFVGRTSIDFVINISNGDKWNRSVNFTIGDIFF